MSEQEQTNERDTINSILASIRHVAIDGTMTHGLSLIQQISRTTEEVQTARKIGAVISSILADHPFLERATIRLSFTLESGSRNGPYRSFYTDLLEDIAGVNERYAPGVTDEEKEQSIEQGFLKIGENLTDGIYDIYHDGSEIYDLLDFQRNPDWHVDIPLDRQVVALAIARRDEEDQGMGPDVEIDPLAVFAATFPARYTQMIDDLHVRMPGSSTPRPKG